MLLLFPLKSSVKNREILRNLCSTTCLSTPCEFLVSFWWSFARNLKKRKIYFFFPAGFWLFNEKVIMHHRSIVHHQLTVNFKGPWLGRMKRKWSDEQTLHNDSSCRKSMPGKLDPFFQMTLLIHSTRAGSRSECLGTGACLRAEDLCLNMHIQKSSHTPS